MFGWHFLVIALILTVLNVLELQWMKAPTTEGRQLLAEIEGFRHFLTSVERFPMQRSEAPSDGVGLYEKYLPYAVALEVEQAWCDRFVALASTFHHHVIAIGDNETERLGPYCQHYVGTDGSIFFAQIARHAGDVPEADDGVTDRLGGSGHGIVGLTILRWRRPHRTCKRARWEDRWVLPGILHSPMMMRRLPSRRYARPNVTAPTLQPCRKMNPPSDAPRWAGVPLAVLIAVMAALWRADLRGSYDPPWLLFTCNFFFATLAATWCSC